MSKRKLPIDDDDEDLQTLNVSNKKHTLDSDEEDSDDYEREDDLHDSDIEGEEEGVAGEQDEVKITPFNMREELEEGHFDKDGQYHWNKDAEIKDNWLDNIDWVKVKKDKNYFDAAKQDDSNDSSLNVFNENKAYAEVLAFMQPSETVQSTLQRLGKSRVKLSSAERLRRKKAGIVDEAGEKITKFTELTNEILTKTGNMDIYQETYEQIKLKIGNLPSSSKNTSAQNADDELDMFAEEVNNKTLQAAASKADDQKASETPTSLQWEYKWKQEDADAKIEGPFSTEQMLKWTQENRFKDGVYVRKVGDPNSAFYSSKRIDFDLYL